ncbi:MAG: hypothetical protein MUF01_08680 [Bryobacterales bacterium]|nr:hypothetical protein [Bryobacterales bacterium]
MQSVWRGVAFIWVLMVGGGLPGWAEALEARTVALAAAGMQPFEENRGQAPAIYSHLLRGVGYTAGFREDALVVALGNGGSDTTTRVLRFSWKGARAVRATGEHPASTRVYDLSLTASSSSDASASSAIPTWQRLRHRDVYPGVDVVYYQNGGLLEFDLEFAPGAAASAPVLRIDGADSLELNAAGNLVIMAPGGQVVQRAPHSYQTVNGERRTVASRYRILDGQHVAIDVDDHDTGLPLTVDPILDFATHFGGAGEMTFFDIATDAAGNVYLMGPAGNGRLPGDGDAFAGLGVGSRNLYITRLSPDLSAVHRTTYLSTPFQAISTFGRMAVAPDGQVYITHPMRGPVGQFAPTTGPFVYPSDAGGNRIERTALFALVPDGSALRFRTLIGCHVPLFLNLLHAAADGLTFASGADCQQIPSTSGAFTNLPANALGSQIIVGRVTPDGQQMAYLTRFGGSGSQEPSWIQRDAEGRVWLGGSTSSPDFPTTPGAYQTTGAANYIGFLMRFNAAGSAVEAATLLPGRIPRFRIAPDGGIHVSVRTARTDFQVSPQAFQMQRGTNARVLLRIDAELRTIDWSTYYLGSAEVEDLAVNAAGETLVVSRVTSSEVVSPGAMLRRLPVGSSLHVGRVAAGGVALRNATYFYSTFPGNATRILSFQGGVSTLILGPTADTYATPGTTSSSLTVDQPGQPFGVYLARIRWDDPTACTLALSPASQTVSAEGGEALVRVEAPPGCPWALSANSVNSSGEAVFVRSAGVGNGDVRVRYPRWNQATQDNVQTWRIDDQQVTVTQSRASCSRRSISPASVDVDAAGGFLSLALDIPQDCEWELKGAAPWTTLSANLPHGLPELWQGPLQLRLEVLPNSFEARETSFTIAGINVPVRQAGGACTATVSPLTIDLPASGGTAAISITTSASNCPWTALASSDLTVVGSSTGTGSGVVQVNMPANPTNVTLQQTLLLANKTVQVRQAGGQCQATVGPLSFQGGPSADAFSINIEATGTACAWKPVATEPWLQFFPGSAPEGSGQLQVWFRENTSGATRTALVRLLGHTVNVTQLGEPATYVSFDVPQGELFTVNGVSHVGPFQTALPLGTTVTVSALPRRQPEPGLLVLNSGWNDVAGPTQTFTIGSQPILMRLNQTRFFRLLVSHTGNVSGDGSRTSLTLEPGNFLEEPDGHYVRQWASAFVRAVPGSQSRFVRWDGVPSEHSRFQDLPITMTRAYTLVAVFEASGPPPPLQFSPPRLTLRYGSTQDITTAVATLTAASAVPVEVHGFGCDALSFPPFLAVALAPRTPSTLRAEIYLPWAALVDPGQYVCEVRVQIAGNAATSLSIPVDLTVVAKPLFSNGVRIAAITEGAGFRRKLLAPGAIYSIFGQQLSAGVLHASNLPLPVALGGTSVELIHLDSGQTTAAPLFFVSPGQINFMVPRTFPPGRIDVKVNRTGFFSDTFPSFVQEQQGSLFAANSDGKGAPAGEFLRVNGRTGARVSGSLAVCPNGGGSCVPRRLSFGSPDETLYLILYGTGFSVKGGLAAASLGSEEVPVEFTGAHGSFVGLDQINVRVPRSLAGRGMMTLVVGIGGHAGNPLQVEFE